MHFEPGNVYHVYNRGNNKVRIFFSGANYLFLLRKIRKEWLRYCNIYCYCLMPNHFHFMLEPNEQGCEYVFLKNQPSHIQLLSKAIGKTLSSYTQAINLQEGTTGNLFQKKTKAKCLTDVTLQSTDFTSTDYMQNCFWYIHYNPAEAGLITNLEDWRYSSFPDYYGFRNGTLCAKEKALARIGISETELKAAGKANIDKKIIDGIW